MGTMQHTALMALTAMVTQVVIMVDTMGDTVTIARVIPTARMMIMVTTFQVIQTIALFTLVHVQRSITVSSTQAVTLHIHLMATTPFTPSAMHTQVATLPTMAATICP